MDLSTHLKNGLLDELEKIAGYSRIGKRPFKALTLLKKSNMTKLSTKVPSLRGGSAKKTLALMGLGAVSYDQLRKAHQDWRTGRAMRKQQGYY